jgi:hypothetical protein
MLEFALNQEKEKKSPSSLSLSPTSLTESKTTDTIHSTSSTFASKDDITSKVSPSSKNKIASQTLPSGGLSSLKATNKDAKTTSSRSILRRWLAEFGYGKEDEVDGGHNDTTNETLKVIKETTEKVSNSEKSLALMREGSFLDPVDFSKKDKVVMNTTPVVEEHKSKSQPTINQPEVLPVTIVAKQDPPAAILRKDPSAVVVKKDSSPSPSLPTSDVNPLSLTQHPPLPQDGKNN